MSVVHNLTPPPVAPEDEVRHPPGPEEWWNESWYLDLAEPSGAVGAYVRFGLYPNRSETWFQLVVVGEDRPLTVLSDQRAPLASGMDLVADGWSATVTPTEPLARMRVQASASARQHDDPAAVYRGEPGRPVEASLDLTWTSRAAPYHYGLTTRYEVSCDVAGTVEVDGEVIPIDAPGQRDHSWGVRDWWAFRWCWSAGALDDGTAFHATDIRFADSTTGFGYVLRPDGQLLPATEISATEDLGEHGLPTRGSLAVEPGGVAVEVEPVGFGPLVFTADDGRTNRFPRALCRFRADDGRTGAGWVEWNQLEELP